MNFFKNSLIILAGLAFIFTSCAKRTPLVEHLIKARDGKVPLTRPTLSKPEMTADEAYDLQHKLVNQLTTQRGEELIGYKLSPKTIKDPNNPEKMVPVYGHLFKSMLVPAGSTLKRSDFIDLHLENEIAFIIGKEIDPKTIEKPGDLKPYVKSIVPAIEMPEVRYTGSLDEITGIDFVVDNVGASKLMLGKAVPTEKINADRVLVKMIHDGRVINRGKSTMVEGSPWNALFWLVKELEKKNTTLKPDQLIMTGGIAKFMDSKPGKYRALYKRLGKVTFKIED